MRVVLSLLCLLAAYSVRLVSGEYACPHPPAAAGMTAIPIEETFRPQPNYQTEWVYVVGSLCIVDPDPSEYASALCENPLGFHITIFFYNVSGGNSSSQTNEILTSAVLAFSYASNHYTYTSWGLPASHPSAEQPFDLLWTSADDSSTIQYTVENGVAGQLGSVYNFVSSTPNATMNLMLQSQTPLMYQGNGGFSGTVLTPPACVAAYYVTMPQLYTTGVVRLNDDIFFVSGVSWLDHEWLTNTANNSPSWTWLGIRVGSVSAMISVPHGGGVDHYSSSSVHLFSSDGSSIKGKITQKQILSNWTSPLT